MGFLFTTARKIESSDIVDYQIVLPDDGATTLDFAGLVTSIGMEVPTDDKVTASVEVKITGQVTLSS